MIGISVSRRSRNSADFQQRLRVLGRKVQAGQEAAAELLHQESMILVPKDTVALMESSRVRIEGEGFAAVAFVGYGIPGEVYVRWSEKEKRLVTRIPAKYAVLVHQLPVPHDAGQYNFLESPRTGKLIEMREAFRTAFNTTEV